MTLPYIGKCRLFLFLLCFFGLEGFQLGKEGIGILLLALFVELAADHIVDIGPGAGIHGGNIVCSGTVQDIMNCPESITGAYLSGRKKIEIPEKRREGNGKKTSCPWRL